MATVIRSRWYLVIALTLAAFIVIGFARTYYLRPWFDVPPITLLLHAHGVVFSAWVALFVVQVRLISMQNYAAHMKLGIVGMMLAMLVFALGIASSIASVAEVRPRPMGMTPEQFSFMPVSSILLFGGFVAAALLLRRRPQVHKRLMVLAMISVLGPPAARLIRWAGLGENFLLIQTCVAAGFVTLGWISDWVRHKALHPVFLIGGGLLVLSWPARVWFARTPAWEAVGSWMRSLNG
jgi:hypothetical protein